MLGKNITIKGIFTTILFVTLGFTQVSLEMNNLDLTAGTLDIYMTNTAACSYCEESTYNNNTQNWVDQKEDCETNGATWVAYDPITEEECSAIPSLTGNGGWWFNGEVGGFQFELTNIEITGASGGSASDNDFSVSTVGINVVTVTTAECTNPPCTFNSRVLGFSFTGT